MQSNSGFQSESNSDDISRHLVHPPTDGPAVCVHCRSWANGRDGQCHNCRDVESMLGEVWNVLPISLYVKPSELRDWLKFYKPSGGEEYDPKYGSKLQKSWQDFSRLSCVI